LRSSPGVSEGRSQGKAWLLRVSAAEEVLPKIFSTLKTEAIRRINVEKPSLKLRGESKQHGPRDDRDSEIDGVEGGREHERDARDRDDRRREGDGPHGRSFVRDRGKHRESRPPVVLAAPERESPEMARGPEEYEEGDENGRKADGIRCGSGC